MEIYHALKQLKARGKNKAVPAKVLAKMLHTSLRQVKKWVEIERRRHFICSKTTDGGGYFRPANSEEIKEYLKQQENRIAKHAVTMRLARQLAKRKERQKLPKSGNLFKDHDGKTA